MKRRANVPFVIFFTIFVLAVIFGVVYYASQKNRGKVYEDLAEDVKKPTTEPQVTEYDPAPTDTITEDPSASPTPTKVPVDVPIDFEKLWAVNPDVYAWITIPGTVIDYPILQSTSDPEDYYLDHTVERVQGLPGSIYTRMSNSRDFSDRVTVIYGHNMKNGTMFGHLHDYKNEAFTNEHDTIIIYTPEHILTYKIFAAVLYDNRLITESFDFSTDEGTQAYLDSLHAVNNFRTYFRDVEVTKSDRIITLSTCISNDAQRYLIQGVLVDEQ